MVLLQMTHGSFACGGLYQFFESKSFNAMLSIACSATMRLSLAFSASSCRSRCASLTFIPPNRVPPGRIPGVKGVGTDIVLAAYICCLDAAFLLLEDADDLLLAEPSFHAFLLLD